MKITYSLSQNWVIFKKIENKLSVDDKKRIKVANYPILVYQLWDNRINRKR